jgi:hypothetical protein
VIEPPPPVLLAVDLGLRTGLALYGRDGRLIWYRGHNYGATTRLRAGAARLVRELDGLAWLVAEGDAALARPWLRAAAARGAETRLIGAERWRARLFLERERADPERLKDHAVALATRVITWSRAAPPKGPVRHDVAEAILVGLWGVLEAGWLDAPPDSL